MMRTVAALTSPFGDATLHEIPLPNAPLVRVIAQVKFAEIASVTRREFIGPFQEAIRDDYPILRAERGVTLTIGPDGVAQTEGEQIWRFHSGDELWRVSLAPTFLAIETDAYVSRSDFFDRLREVVEATAAHLKPAFWERLGVRYIDRVEDPDALNQLKSLVRPEVLGLAGTDLQDELQALISQAQFSLPNEIQLVARTGVIPAGGTHDPTIDPATVRTWTLDLDVSVTHQATFNVDDLDEQGRDLAAHAYRFFRWAVTKEFLKYFGASDEDLAKEDS